MNTGLLDTGTLSTENIMYQKDDAIVATIKHHMTTISRVSEEVGDRPTKLSRRRDVRVALGALDEACSKRFGFKIKTSLVTWTLAATQTVAPKTLNVLSGDIAAKYKRMRDALDDVKKSEPPKNADADGTVVSYIDILKTNIDAIDAVEDKLQTANITVDLEKARVYGFPTNATCMVMLNPTDMVHKYGLTVEEMTAMYLHEVGHIFTHLEYSHRTVRQTSEFLDSLVKDLNKNMSPVKALKLSYKKVFDDDKLDDADGVVSVAVGVASRYLDNANYGGNTYSNKDSERLADQFSARFGMGGYISSGLDKVFSHNSDGIKTLGKSFATAAVTILVIGVILYIMAQFIALFLTFIVGAITALALYIAITGFLAYGLFSMVSGIADRGIDATYPYDSPKRRIQRLRTEIIRQLRQENVDKDERDGMVEAIDTMSEVMTKHHANDENAIYRAVGVFFSYRDEQLSMREIDNRVSDLINNDVHVTAEKIKSLA